VEGKELLNFFVLLYEKLVALRTCELLQHWIEGSSQFA